MAEEIGNHRDILLSREGKRIENLDEINPGDILSIHSLDDLPYGPNHIRLYYVNSIEKEPKMFNVPYAPFVSFKRPHIGVSFSKPTLENCAVHLYIPSSVENCRCSWEPKENEREHIYLLRSGTLYELGKLIPDFEVPDWNFLFQPGDILRFNELHKNTKRYFEETKQLYEKIKQEFEK
ncbi:MAG: hypothetical protein ACP5OG_00540 [Candidatus Nanoarchaeia archaeon]